MIGKTILHYKITAKLGEGGMGVVYKAEDTKLKRDVAIKFLPRQIAASEEERARFKIEAQAAAVLNHPNIATIHAIEEQDDELFIVMEYIEGQELKSIIDNRQLSIVDVFDYASQIAAGLQAAHEKGIVHRDIKSSNIMITDKGQVKIMDFGLAKVRGGVQFTKVGTTLGTAAYMSPEQARGEEVDQRSDIWSFGVVLYEMLTGQLPFRGDYEQSMIYSILNEDPKPLQEQRSEVPEALAGLVRRALAKDVHERYQGADEVLADLTAFQRGGRAAQAPLRARVRSAGSGRIWLALAALLVAVLSIALFHVLKPKPGGRGVSISLAVMPFEFEGEEDDWNWLGDAITELVNTDLAEYPSVRVLDAQQRRRITRTLGIHGENTTLEQALQIARKAKVRHVVLGRLRKSGQTVRVQAQIFETDKGTVLAELGPFEGEPARLYEVADNLSARLIKKINIGSVTDRSVGRVAERATTSLDAFRYYIEGKDAALDHRYQEGIAKLIKAIELDSTFVRAYYYLAWQYSQVGDHVKAKATLAKGKPYVSRLSEADRLEYLCEEAKYDNRWKDYVTYLEQLLRINPSDATVHFRYGWTQFYKFRQLDAGIRAMEKAVALDSSYGWAYNILGYAFLQQGDKRKALEMIEKYVALNPTDVNPLDSKAEIQVLIGQYDEAIANCERIFAMQADFLSARIILSRAYLGKGKITRALETTDEYMRLTTNPYFKSMGQTVKVEALLLRGQFEEALDSAGRAIAMDSTNLKARWMRGRILLQLSDEPALSNELAALDRALRAQGSLDNRWLLYHLQGEMALRHRNFDRAIELFKKALALGPLDRSFYLAALARAYEQSGQIQMAVEQYNSALALNPNNALTAVGLGRSYEQLNDWSKALRAYNRVLEIWSEADEDLPELIYTKGRLEKLRSRLHG
jgi:tetratricopeptide (TPR) repeat protein/predicted Ser/Thr protein kinase